MISVDSLYCALQGTIVQFHSEEEHGIVPFKLCGIAKDYNGIDITQTPDSVEMSCKNYIARLLKLHGWDTISPSDSKSELESASKFDEAKITTMSASLSIQNVNHVHVENNATSALLELSPHNINI